MADEPEGDKVNATQEHQQCRSIRFWVRRRGIIVYHGA
jgi:hypothetical protein